MIMSIIDEEKVGKGICPSCGEKDTLHFGPQGGASTNFACFSCMTRFNAGFIWPAGILFLDRTGMISERDKVMFRPQSVCYDWDYAFGV